MLPMIEGIALFPTHYRDSAGTVAPTNTDFKEIPCSSSCEVPYAEGIHHHLVCAGNRDGDYDHVSVDGAIFKKSGAYAPQEHLELMPLGKERGRDGSCRMYWEWPNKQAFREINATYEVRFRLLKMPDADGSSTPLIRNPPPFTVRLLPAPVAPQPAPRT